MESFINEEEVQLRDATLALARRHFAHTVRDFELATGPERAALVAATRNVLGEAGLLGIRVPIEYGGGGGTLMQGVVAIEALASVNPYVGSLLGATIGNQTLAIAEFGNVALKERFLPRIASGVAGGAIAISEPSGGSDVGAMRTQVRVDGDGLLLNGEKAYITDADVAEFIIVAARMSDAKGISGVGMVVVERSWDGVSIDRVDVNMMGGREVNVSFKDVRVPAENVLLRAGEFKRFLLFHNAQRCQSGAVSLGVAQGAYQEAMAYAKEREVFGAKIADHQGIRWMLVDIVVKLEAMRLIVYRAARAFNVDRSESPAECFIAKLYANETGAQVVADAQQVFGCFGLSREGMAELRYRYAKGLCVAGGTPQVLRNGLAHQVIDKGVR